MIGYNKIDVIIMLSDYQKVQRVILLCKSKVISIHLTYCYQLKQYLILVIKHLFYFPYASGIFNGYLINLGWLWKRFNEEKVVQKSF